MIRGDQANYTGHAADSLLQLKHRESGAMGMIYSLGINTLAFLKCFVSR
jgi:hypothetical protein